MRRLIRKLRYAVPDLQGLRGEGVDAAALAEAAGAEGLAGAADGLVVVAEQWDGVVPDGVRAVAVVAKVVRTDQVPVSERPATRCVLLREWVAEWPLDWLLRGVMGIEAVGGKTCHVRWAGRQEWIFAEGGDGVRFRRRAGVWALATVCGVGAFPFMPATLMCALMVPVAVAVLWLWGGGVFFALALAVAAAATALSVAIERGAAEEFFAEDPREFVLDEVAGQAVAWCFLGFAATPWAIVAGFFAFRFFDIFKFGVDWVEKVPIPGRIVWDDVLAGVYAGVVIAVVAVFS